MISLPCHSLKTSEADVENSCSLNISQGDPDGKKYAVHAQ